MSGESNKKILSGIGWAYGERILAQMISLIVSIILARILDPAHYGIIAIVTVFINILDALVSGGFGNALVQKKDADDLDFNTICWFSIAIAIILYICLFFASPYIAAFYDMEELVWVTRIMSIRVIISAFNSVQHAYVQRRMEFRRFFFATLGGTLISAVVGIFMAYQGFGVWALVAQYMTNSVIDTIVLRFTIQWKPKLEYSFERMNGMMSFGLKMLAATLVNTLQDNIRSLVVGKVFTKEDLAYYNQGKKYPATLMNNLVGSIQKVLFPAFSELQDDKQKIKAQMRTGIRMSSFILVPVIAGVIGIADTFVIAILTEKWSPSIQYLRILSLIYLTRTMNSIFQSSLLAVGQSGANMIHEVVGSVLSIIFICIGAFGMRSVLFIAWSSVIVMIVGTGIFMYFISKAYEYTPSEVMRDFLPYLAISSVMGLCVYYTGTLATNKLLLLIIQIIVGVAVYGILSYVFRIKELKTCVRLMKQLASKMSKRKV